jgi:arylsulfatase A-like enzyme
MKSSLLALALAACVWNSVLGQTSPAPVPAARPNILFLFADDQRADTIAALGNPNIQTPNLDRLCRQGLAFRRAYMQGGFNGATCVPSRAMLLSGQSLFHIDEKLLRDETWPAAFQRAGYTTFISGKWHNGQESVPKCFSAGRALFTSGMSTNPLSDSVRDLENGKLSAPRRVNEHLCAAFADEVIQFLKEPRKTSPFFCYVPFDAPHDPHIVPPDFPVIYDPAKIPLPPNFLPQHPFDNGEMSVRDEKLLPHPRPPEGVRKLNAEYYRYITFLDAQIGRILDALASSPFATNTIVVFSADSGVARGSHGLIGKQNLYEYDSVRVPLIIAGPGIPTGQTTDAMCYLYDVLPTLGARCGVPAPQKSEGLDLNKVLDGGIGGRESLVFAYRGVQRAIATREWKLIRYPKVNQVQLYNLREDPYEIHNLAGKPEYAARVAELNARLTKELTAAGDKQP